MDYNILLIQILMKLIGNVLDIKRVNTELRKMFAHSCSGMPIICAQIKQYLVPEMLFLDINLINQISMKLAGNVFDM